MDLVLNEWFVFCTLTALAGLMYIIMSFASRYFFTYDVSLREFDLLDLKLASCEKEITNLISGISKTGAANSAIITRKMKIYLYAGFVFMPAACGALFILCQRLAARMPFPGYEFFSLLGWLQIIAWLSHLFENIYLLYKLRNRANSGQPFHFKAFQFLRITKWPILLLALLCSFSVLAYFWLSGQYSRGSLQYALITGSELIIFLILIYVSGNAGRSWRRSLTAS